MTALLRMLMKPIIRPLARLVVGLLAIPTFRFVLRRVTRGKELDEELEKDLEQWFRGALVLLVATKNMETQLFDWALAPETPGNEPILFFFRLSLAIAVIEFMPDQELFAIIHANPPRLSFKDGYWKEIKAKWWPYLMGTLGQQVNRYAPVFAILSVAFEGVVGWTAYGVAIALYLFIGLITSKDKALDVLGEFDQQVALKRRELIEEFHLEEKPLDFTPAPPPESPAASEQSDQVADEPLEPPDLEPPDVDPPGTSTSGDRPA